VNRSEFKMIIREGLIELELNSIAKGNGPGRKAPGYYSQAMVISRDLTISVLKNYFYGSFKALDMLGGSGIRGLRIEKECKAEVTINDNNPKALEIIKRNRELNFSKARITSLDASRCIENFYDYIDIDPYGSPVPFLDPALKSIKKYGLIGVTATDLPNLTGTNFKKGIELYHSKIIRNYYSHESGLRALISFIIKRSAEYELALRPILSFYGGYYYRIFFKVEKGSKKLEKNLDYIQSLNYLSRNKELGPIWIGNIHDTNFIKNLIIEDYMQNSEKIKKYKEIFLNENILFFYSLEELSKKFKRNIPKIDEFISYLKDLGYSASRTQFSNIGIKTNASFVTLRKIFNERFIK